MIENTEKAPLQAWKRNLQGTFLNCVFLPLVLLVLSNYNTQTFQEIPPKGRSKGYIITDEECHSFFVHWEIVQPW